MKQHITKKQFGEISDELQTKFWRAVTIICDNHDAASGSEDCDCSNPSIGQMIEFLGNDWLDMEYTKGFKINLCVNEILCDALWEGVKEGFEK